MTDGYDPFAPADDFATLDRAGKLEKLSGLALDDLYRILTMPAGAEGVDARKVEGMKERARKEVLTLQARVDSDKLRAQAADKLGELFDLMKAEGAKRRAVKSLEQLAVNGTAD